MERETHTKYNRPPLSSRQKSPRPYWKQDTFFPTVTSVYRTLNKTTTTLQEDSKDIQDNDYNLNDADLRNSRSYLSGIMSKVTFNLKT